MEMEKLKLRKNRLFSLLASLVILMGCSPQTMDAEFYKHYLGVDILPLKEVFSYKEESAPGEGFSYTIIQYKNEGKLDFKKGYPIKDEYKQNWKVSEWKETPAIDNEKDFDIIFKYSINDKKIRTKIDEIKDIMKKKGNYYCYYYKKSSDYVESINLYIIDVEAKTLHVFNIET